MRQIAAVVALALWAFPIHAEEKLDRLMRAMQMDQAIEILRDEGKAAGQEIKESFLNNAGGPVFDAQVDRIYDPVWMHDEVSKVFRQELTDSQLERAIVFFESDLGQTIVALEHSARVAFADEAIEELAKDSYRNEDQDSEKFQLVTEFIQVNDLVDQNVQNAISADYSFFRGMSEFLGGDDAELLAELLTQQGSITQETETWLYSFLLLAYKPLSDAQMRENIAFSRTDTGKAINTALFESFDRMYDAIYFQIGQAVSQVLSGSDL